MRHLPFSMEAEQSVLGAFITKPEDCFETVGSIITSADFYVEEHRLIFSTLTEMYANSRTIDPVTLVNALVEHGSRDQSGGVQYIAQLATMVPSASNVRDYAVIVHEKALLRRLIDACEEVSAEAYAEEGEVSHIVDSAEQRFFEIAQNRDTREFRHIRDVLETVYQGYTTLAHKEGAETGIKTGFSYLDNFLVEIGKGDFVLVGARPGMGKTAFALNLASNIAKSSKKTVCIFSLEMSAEQLVNRMMASEAMVDSKKLRTGDLKPEEWQKLAHAATELSGLDILIDDTTSINPIQMKAKLRRQKNLGLVVIDYLGLMQAGRKIDNRVQEVSEITRNIKIMAKELGVPVICCAQLSRGTEGRNDKRPQLSDLRDSGSIEQDADMVLFLYRSNYYETDNKEEVTEANTAEVIVAKNRHGSVGTVKMGWMAQFTKFVTIENAGQN